MIRLPEPFPLKNHGFIYVGNNRWRLSPTFDINAQPRRTPQMETGISPLSGFDPDLEAAIEAAIFFDIESGGCPPDGR